MILKLKSEDGKELFVESNNVEAMRDTDAGYTFLGMASGEYWHVKETASVIMRKTEAKRRKTLMQPDYGRPVIVMKKKNVGDGMELVDDYAGTFMAIAPQFLEFETGPGNYTVILVERNDGEIFEVEPELVKFTDRSKDAPLP